MRNKVIDNQDSQIGAPSACLLAGDTLQLDEFARIITEHIRDGVLVQDVDGHILWANSAYCRMTGYDFEEMKGRKPQEIIFPDDMRHTKEEIESFRYDPEDPALKGLQIFKNQRKNGEIYWAQLSFGFYEVPEGTRVVVAVRDVTDQIEAQESLAQAKSDLERAVHYDALTGLANRRMLMEYLGDSLVNAAAESARVGLLHVDLDRFKEVNDTHGHAAGDAVLVAAAKAMDACLEGRGLAARIGGDEFILVVPGINSLADVEDVAQSLMMAVTAPVAWEGRQLSYGFSIGAALSEYAQGNDGDLIQKADFALYEAKAGGRGRWAIYNASLERKHKKQKGMADDLIRSIENGHLEFYFQPIMRVADRRIAGLETLVRWRHPRKGLILPDQFLGIAEEIGFLEKLDRAGMHAAVEAARHIKTAGFDDLYVSFNASTHLLADQTLIEEMLWKTSEFGVEPERIAIEVLETVFMEDDTTETLVAEQIRLLREAGFITLLDDFGVGYAGLSHLGQLDVSGFKIDRSLIKDIASEQTTLVIVKAILQLSQDLGLHVIAEGVEDQASVDLLAQHGCEFVQGYVLTKPMPLPDLTAWLQHVEPLGHTDASGPVTRKVV